MESTFYCIHLLCDAFYTQKLHFDNQMVNELAILIEVLASSSFKQSTFILPEFHADNMSKLLNHTELLMEIPFFQGISFKIIHIKKFVGLDSKALRTTTDIGISEMQKRIWQIEPPKRHHFL